MHFVYIVRCADGSLYTGYARDPQKRAEVHNNGRGARYTAGRRPVRLVYFEACGSAGAALRREYQLKGWSRARKESLIATGSDWSQTGVRLGSDSSLTPRPRRRTTQPNRRPATH